MNQVPKFKAVINKLPVLVDSNLQSFELFKKPSSNVDYFAIDKAAGQLFIQFLNGKCYLYLDVDEETLKDAVESESIGKFFYARIKSKFADQPVGDRCIVPDDQDEEEDLEGEDDFDIDHSYGQ